MIIYATINTEAKTIAVETDEDFDYCVEWHKVEFDNMSIQEIIQDVEEEISKTS